MNTTTNKAKPGKHNLQEQERVEEMLNFSSRSYLSQTFAIPEFEETSAGPRSLFNAENGGDFNADAEILPLSINGNSFTITPPFTTSLLPNIYPAHPTNYYDGTEVPFVANPFANVNAQTGEISMSLLAGRYGNWVYGPLYSEYLQPLVTRVGYYRGVYAGIRQTIKLSESYNYNTVVQIIANLQAPYHGEVFALFPTYNDDNYSSLVGAEGFVDLSVTLGGIRQSGRHTKFLDAWKNANASPTHVYKTQFECQTSFILPAGSSRIDIEMLIRLYAHVGRFTPGEFNYTMIDFRHKQFENNPRIWADSVFEFDHKAPGPIVLKNLQVNIRPQHVVDPSTDLI